MSSDSGGGSRGLLWLVPAGLALTTFFVFLGFPYERLADFAASEAERATGARVDYRDVGPSFHWAGPGVTATGVRALVDGGEPLQFDRVVLRPAWTLSWLRGRPALYCLLDGPPGRAEGVLTLGASGGYAGELTRTDVAALPMGTLWPGTSLEGTLDATVEVQRNPGGPKGRVEFEALDGTVALAGFPMALPFESLTGALRFGDEAFLEIEALALQGPLLAADVTGRVEPALTFVSAPLQVQIQLTAEPVIRNALRMAGVRIGEDGSARVRIAGTPGRPLVR